MASWRGKLLLTVTHCLHTCTHTAGPSRACKALYSSGSGDWSRCVCCAWSGATLLLQRDVRWRHSAWLKARKEVCAERQVTPVSVSVTHRTETSALRQQTSAAVCHMQTHAHTHARMLQILLSQVNDRQTPADVLGARSESDIQCFKPRGFTKPEGLVSSDRIPVALQLGLVSLWVKDRTGDLMCTPTNEFACLTGATTPWLSIYMCLVCLLTELSKTDLCHFHWLGWVKSSLSP